MGYGRALLMKDVREEEASLQKKAKKKSLWGSIGRTIGGLGVMALTGGAVNPVTLGLLTGGASFLGGAAGAKLSGTGDLSKQGKFFKSDREDIQKELGAFGTTNLTESLKSGLIAGFGQAAKLQKAKLLDKPIVAAPTTKQGLLKSMDFEGSLVGKSLEKETAARHASKIAEADKLFGGDRTAAMKDFQFGKGDVTAFDYDQMVGDSADVSIDQGLIGPTEASIPFDRSRMLKTQAAARFQGTRGTPIGTSGSGADFTKTSAWEGVGESFPVTSPDFIRSDASRVASASEYSAGKSALFDTERHKSMQDMISWQKRLRLE
jgi:hypothetical protein|tara:strand:- start:4 stop:963 length:960 start_codon:yes stop_codon:yes gene_type:complete